MSKYYTLPQVVAILNRQYDNVYYAVKSKKIPQSAAPRCIGKAMLFTAKQIDELKNFFNAKHNEARVEAELSRLLKEIEEL